MEIKQTTAIVFNENERKLIYDVNDLLNRVRSLRGGIVMLGIDNSLITCLSRNLNEINDKLQADYEEIEEEEDEEYLEDEFQRTLNRQLDNMLGLN